MKAQLVAFFILSTFLLFAASFSWGAQQQMNLNVTVASNIRAYFDGQDVIANTNDQDSVLVIKEKIQFPSGTGYEYTIVPKL